MFRYNWIYADQIWHKLCACLIKELLYAKVELLIRNVNIHIVLNRNEESNITYKYQLKPHSIRSHSTDTTVGFIGCNTMGWITLRSNRTPISEQDTFPMNPLHRTVSKSSSEAAKRFLINIRIFFWCVIFCYGQIANQQTTFRIQPKR
jgi:hypothetical protein